MLTITNILLFVALSATTSNCITEFSRDSAAFSQRLYNENIIGSKSENLIFSPLSIQTALGLTYIGSNGRTEEELRDGLYLRQSSNKFEVSQNFDVMLTSVKNINPIVLIANKIYVQSGQQLNPDFKNIATRNFKSEIENVNFLQPVDSALLINNWVDNRTNHIITNLISPDDIDDRTEMILVNAIYFKGAWRNQFDKANTETKSFWISPHRSVDVEMMSTQMPCLSQYIIPLRSQSILLGYQGSDISMMIILPDNRDGLEYLEKNLEKINLLDVVGQMVKEDSITVQIPKFKIESSIELNDVLSQMGMSSIFSENANFSGIFESGGSMQVSRVIHKAFIEVNEEGSVAAGATGVQMGYRGRSYFTHFIADHPFFYAILNEKTVLFAGRVVNPNVE